MPEKLLSIREVAEYLKLSEEEVKRLVDAGEVPAYKIGDTFLRFRKEQIDAIKREISEIEAKEPEHAKPVLDAKGHPSHALSDLERDIKRREPSARQYDYSFPERVSDFFYFNDYYLVCFALIAVLMLLIIRSS